ncbi:hypothetical protein NITHO_5490002 [Nitrolancea hollandica Lb]|uniref:PKS/mFAS DH domain-containing protein n=1 Tax=Nitrolancea hollandica Lb TaxID=1129897 RepID=I4EM06_9BACT|nr:hypothetical protein NITHO_5490002 [Nitrolancea hollandica Lb]
MSDFAAAARNGKWGAINISLPLLPAASRRSPGPSGGLEIVRSLDPAHDLYLNDHRIDGLPVFPFAMAIELMAEVAAAGWPELEVRSIRQVRLLRGITVDRTGQPVRVTARPAAHEPGDGTRSGRYLDLTIASADEPRIVHYRSVVELGPRTTSGDLEEPDWPGGDPWTLDNATPFPMSVADAYRDWLFHGPLFQGITAVGAIGPTGARATLRHSSPQLCLNGGPAGDWLIDPVVIDSALQMQLLWARLHWNVTMLPSALQEYRRFRPLRREPRSPGGPNEAAGIRHELRIRPVSQPPICHADHYFYGSDGQLLGALTDMMGAGSAAFNRLAGAGRR